MRVFESATVSVVDVALRSNAESRHRRYTLRFGFALARAG
jgi:hypothetical protein